MLLLSQNLRSQVVRCAQDALALIRPGVRSAPHAFLGRPEWLCHGQWLTLGGDKIAVNGHLLSSINDGDQSHVIEDGKWCNLSSLMI